MIQSFIDTPVTLTSNSDSVRFQRDCIRTNSCNACNSRGWLCHNQGSANYEITKGGIYEINFNGTVSSASAGSIALQLYNNGEAIPGTLMVETIATAGDFANVGINKKITVCCNGNSTISVRSVASVPTPTDPTTPVETVIPIIANANFSIEKKS